MSDTISIPEFSTVVEQLGDQVVSMDFTQVLDDFLPEIASQHSEMFGGQHDSNGSPWAVLAPSTVARKGQDRILFETGALMESLVTIGGSNNIAEAFPRGLVFGTSDEKAMFHQEGTLRMPARPPVGLSEETLDRLVNRVADAAVENLRTGAT